MPTQLTDFEQSLKDNAASVYTGHNTTDQKSAVYDNGGAGAFIHDASSHDAKYTAKLVNQSGPCGVVGQRSFDWSSRYDGVYGSGMEIDIGPDADIFIRNLLVDLDQLAQRDYNINVDGLNVNSCRALYLHGATITGTSDSSLDLKAPAFIENATLNGGYRLARIRKPTVFKNCTFRIPEGGRYFLEMLGEECEVWFSGCEFYAEDGASFDSVGWYGIQRDNTNLSDEQLVNRIHYTDALPEGAEHEFFRQARALDAPDEEPAPEPSIDARLDELFEQVANLESLEVINANSIAKIIGRLNAAKLTI